MNGLTRRGIHQRGRWTKLHPAHFQRYQLPSVYPSADDHHLRTKAGLRVNRIGGTFHSRCPGPANFYTRDMSKLLPVHQLVSHQHISDTYGSWVLFPRLLASLWGCPTVFLLFFNPSSSSSKSSSAASANTSSASLLIARTDLELRRSKDPSLPFPLGLAKLGLFCRGVPSSSFSSSSSGLKARSSCNLFFLAAMFNFLSDSALFVDFVDGSPSPSDNRSA
jgi:hypothetical protein